MSNGIDQLAEGVGKAIKTVPDIYDDGLKPATQASGKTLALIPRAIKAAFAPLEKWILNSEYSVKETEILLENKLQNVSPEKIVPPEAYVGVPAIQAISYSMDSEELRNLYANLLAKAMNSDTKDNVHPAFVDIIKQMSPADADIFKSIFQSEIRPLLDLHIEVDNSGGFTSTAYNISWITSYNPKTVRISINNLIRLGLIEIPFDSYYKADENYDLIRKTEHYKIIKQILENKKSGTVEEEKHIINITSFGNAFYNICVSDEF